MRSPRTPGVVASARSDDRLKRRLNSRLDALSLSVDWYRRKSTNPETTTVPHRRANPPSLLGGTGSGSKLAAAVALLATHAMIMSRRSDLTSRYGTAAMTGMRRPVAARRAPAGEMRDVAKMRPALARAITVTADSTLPFARIQRGHTCSRTAKTARV